MATKFVVPIQRCWPLALFVRRFCTHTHNSTRVDSQKQHTRTGPKQKPPASPRCERTSEQPPHLQDRNSGGDKHANSASLAACSPRSSPAFDRRRTRTTIELQTATRPRMEWEIHHPPIDIINKQLILSLLLQWPSGQQSS